MDGKYQFGLLFSTDESRVISIDANLAALEDTSVPQPADTVPESAFPLPSKPAVVPIKLELIHQFDASGRRVQGATSR
jgi:hypothetical protein